MIPRTLFQKIWDAHVVHRLPEGPALIYVDLHLVHEVTSPQAFEGLRLAGRRVRRPDLTKATVDHNVSTGDRGLLIADQVSARQLDALRRNASEFGVELFDLDSLEQGIVHVIEYTGEAVRAPAMEGRMTVCNMSIEAGARAGMVAPDAKTFAYLAGRPRSPSSAEWPRSVGAWGDLTTDPGAVFDREMKLDA